MLPDVHVQISDTRLLLDTSLERTPFMKQSKLVALLLKAPLSVKSDPLLSQARVIQAILFSLPHVDRRGVLERYVAFVVLALASLLLLHGTAAWPA